MFASSSQCKRQPSHSSQPRCRCSSWPRSGMRRASSSSQQHLSTEFLRLPAWKKNSLNFGILIPWNSTEMQFPMAPGLPVRCESLASPTRTPSRRLWLSTSLCELATLSLWTCVSFGLASLDLLGLSLGSDGPETSHPQSLVEVRCLLGGGCVFFETAQTMLVRLSPWTLWQTFVSGHLLELVAAARAASCTPLWTDPRLATCPRSTRRSRT
mmetsp:Transcript_77362/g.136481  ORF Transcript_77362/g.136481 Transcript_77362/m.136481 type:complete len:212 (-) Transcript_77362:272-907(-)